jgi:segregation and condensation protein B
VSADPTDDPPDVSDLSEAPGRVDAPEIDPPADEPTPDLSAAPADEPTFSAPDEPTPDAEAFPDEPDSDDPLAAVLAELDAPRRPAPAGVQLSEELPIDPEDDLRGVEGEASPRLVSILESLLYAAARPLKVQDLRKILAETSKHQIQLALAHLMAVTRDRGVMLAQVAGGFQYRTHPDNAVWVQKMLQSKPARLSRTQIETLAIVAYRQPITRPEIDDVRGVDSGAVLKGLLERELVQIVGRKEEPGRPLLYGTTVKFLEFFNLRGLRDLPTLRDFRDLSEESKATLRTQLGASEAEALGQGVLGFPTAAAEGPADMQPEQEPTPIELPGNPTPDELVPPAPERLPGPGPDEIGPPDPGTDSPDRPDEWNPPGPDIADVPGSDPDIGGTSEV